MNSIVLNGKTFDAADVVKRLQEQVYPERLQKILSVIEQRNPNFATVVENIYDRGNTSAVMRSAEAFGFYKFHQIVKSSEFKASKRVTQGADKWLVKRKWKSTTECVQHLRDQGFQILVTHLEGGTPLYDLSFDRPTALCFGNEKEGASEELTKLADQKVFIPMQGFVQSFNISVAAALCFQHIHQEMKKQSHLTPLTDEERQKLLALYLFRSCRTPSSTHAVKFP